MHDHVLVLAAAASCMNGMHITCCGQTFVCMVCVQSGCWAMHGSWQDTVGEQMHTPSSIHVHAVQCVQPCRSCCASSNR